GEPEPRIGQLSVPLDMTSVLRTVLMTRGRYLGPMPADPTSQQVLADLGRANPKVAFLYPVEVRERVVAILYADMREKPASDRRVAEFVVLAQQLGKRFERLLLEQKRKLPAPPPPKAEATTAWVHPPAATPATEPIELPKVLTVPAPPVNETKPPAGTNVPRRHPAAGLDLPELQTSYPLTQSDRGTPSLHVQAPGASRRPLAAGVSEPPAFALPSMSELFAGVDRLLESNTAERARALAELARYPEVASAALVARFPGPLLRARLPIQELPLAEELGPIPAALVRMGPPAAQALRPLLEHPDIDIRYFALLTAGRMNAPELLAAVGQRIFDRQAVV
ncbi:MAG: hypothetical protein ACK4N5_27565, partial [Myxococcales bacterium]